jgi:prepilin-type N-terminal cleavage/methylation domain-containing protein/prepilin-type processing-associated H-X9-DG protein
MTQARNLHANRLPGRSAQAGFTLIELLVVISIIALLVAILLPALANARKNAQAISCLSNQRQLFLAQRMYADTYNGYFSQAKMTVSGDSLDGTRKTNWMFLVSEFLNGDHDSQNYYDLPDVLRCPTWPRSWYEIEHSRMGIGMNANPTRPEATSSIFSSAWQLPDGTIQAIRFDDVSHPSEKLMLGDSTVYFVLQKYQSPYFIWELNTPTAVKPWPYISSDPTRHLDSANYLMFDGHGKRLNPDDAMYAIVLK